MMFATVALVSVGLAVALWAGPLYGLCERAAADLVTPGHSRRPGCATDEGSHRVRAAAVRRAGRDLDPAAGRVDVRRTSSVARRSRSPLVVIFPVSATVIHHRLHPWALFKFLVFVLYSLVMSSWAVIKVIVHPTPTSLRSGIVRVQLGHESPLTTTIVANAVTLTPGTMTLTARVDPTELHIHVLGLDDIEEFRESVYDLERRTVAALTPEFPDEAEADRAGEDRNDEGSLP